DDLLPESVMKRVWSQMLLHPGLICLVASEGELLVSSCCLIVIPNLTRGGRPYALIENVVTHSDYRRRGIGQTVVTKALELAWEADCYKVMLLTGSARQEVHSFYERCGFISGDKRGFVARPPIPQSGAPE